MYFDWISGDTVSEINFLNFFAVRSLIRFLVFLGFLILIKSEQEEEEEHREEEGQIDVLGRRSQALVYQIPRPSVYQARKLEAKVRGKTLSEAIIVCGTCYVPMNKQRLR